MSVLDIGINGCEFRVWGGKAREVEWIVDMGMDGDGDGEGRERALSWGKGQGLRFDIVKVL